MDSFSRVITLRLTSDTRPGPPSSDEGAPEEKYLFNEHWQDSTRAAVPEIRDLLLEVSAHAIRNKKKNQKKKAKAKSQKAEPEEETDSPDEGEDADGTAAEDEATSVQQLADE